MEGAQLYRQLALYKNSLFEQGYLDGQFNQLEELQDESNPHFVDEVVTMYLKDSARLLSNMEQALEKNPPDFKKLDAVIHQFRGSSSSIGAVRINNECVIFKQFCDEKNKEGYPSLPFCGYRHTHKRAGADGPILFENLLI
ncbi:unnamed protein product [Victoria cruziana]